MLTVLTHLICLQTKLKTVELRKSNFLIVFMVKGVRTAIQKLGIGERKDISFYFESKILQEILQIWISLALNWFTSELDFH